VATGSVADLAALTAAAVEAVAGRDTLSAEAYRDLTAALGIGYRPRPPVVELLTAAADGDIVALVLDLPEPLPRERLLWSLVEVGRHPTPPLGDLLVAWSEDGASAIIVRAGAKTFPPGRWSLRLELTLNIGAERAVWTRSGDSEPESGTLEFTLS
jgi:hypothetical protein